MKKDQLCTYRLEMSYVDFIGRCAAWQTFGLMAKDIKPTEQSVIEWRNKMNDSLLNGANKHLANTQSLYSNAKLFDQRSGQLVVNYKAPMFEVI